jgi:hypothetical protein
MDNENATMSKLRSLAAEKMVVEDEMKPVRDKIFLGFQGILEFALLEIVTKNYSNALITYHCEGNDDAVDKKVGDLVKFDVHNKDDVTLKIFIKVDYKNDEDQIVTMDFVGRFDCYELPSSGIEERRDLEFKGKENDSIIINCKMRSSYMNLNDEKNRLDNLLHELNHAITESEEALSKSTTTASSATKKNSKNTKKVTKKSPKKAKKVIEDIDTDGEGDDEAVAPAAGSIVSNLTNYLAFTAKAVYDNRSLVLFGISVPIILFFGEMASV